MPISFGKLKQAVETEIADSNTREVAPLKGHTTSKQQRRDMTIRIVAVLTRHALSKQAHKDEEPSTTSKDTSMIKQNFKEQSEEVKEQTKETITEEQKDAAQMDMREDFEEEQTDPKSSKEGGEGEVPETAFFNCPEDKEGWDRQTWIEEQNVKAEHNKGIAEIIKKMQGTVQSDFFIKDGLLMKTTRLQTRESFTDKVVVPESLKAFVIGCHHNLPMHGHQGRKRTERMICSRYYWKGMSKDIGSGSKHALDALYARHQDQHTPGSQK
jgi:hypothetical protein